MLPPVVAMIQQGANEHSAVPQVKGLALILEGNARVLTGVYEHLLESDAGVDMLERLQACEQMCRELAQEINQL